MGHVDLRTEDLLPFRVLAGFHLAEELQVLLRGAVAPGARGAGLVHGAAVQADLLLVLVIDIGEAPLDEVLGPFVQLVEVVRRIEFLVPMEAQPLDVLLDGVHVLGVLLRGVRVVVAEVRLAAVLLRESGGKRVMTASTLPDARSASMISSRKFSLRSSMVCYLIGSKGTHFKLFLLTSHRTKTNK